MVRRTKPLNVLVFRIIEIIKSQENDRKHGFILHDLRRLMEDINRVMEDTKSSSG